MFLKAVKIVNRTGLHARPATQFVETAGRFSSAVSVIRGDLEVDAKSVVGLMLLEAVSGTEITIKAEGQDEMQAVNALVALVEKGFDLEGTEAAPTNQVKSEPVRRNNG